MLRYPRHLSDDFPQLLVPGGPLNFLLTASPETGVAHRCAVDVQIRSGAAAAFWEAGEGQRGWSMDKTGLEEGG